MQRTMQSVTTYTRFADIPDGLRTKSAWRDKGRKVLAGATAKAYYDSYWYKTSYELFSVEDTVPKASRHVSDGCVASFSEDSIVTSIQTINDAAKRRRDSATKAYLRRQHGRAQISSKEKSDYYDLKDRVLARLLTQGRARVVGHHSKTDWVEPPKPYLGRPQFDGFGYELSNFLMLGATNFSRTQRTKKKTLANKQQSWKLSNLRDANSTDLSITPHRASLLTLIWASD